MTPLFRRAISRPMSWLHRKAPVNPTAKSLLQASSGMSSTRDQGTGERPVCSIVGLFAALLIRMSTRPNADSVFASASATARGSVISSHTPSAWTPCAAASALARPTTSASRRSSQTGTPPISATASACWTPRRPAPPVMMATRPVSSNRSRTRTVTSLGTCRPSTLLYGHRTEARPLPPIGQFIGSQQGVHTNRQPERVQMAPDAPRPPTAAGGVPALRPAHEPRGIRSWRHARTAGGLAHQPGVIGLAAGLQERHHEPGSDERRPEAFRAEERQMRRVVRPPVGMPSEIAMRHLAHEHPLMGEEAPHVLQHGEDILPIEMLQHVRHQHQMKHAPIHQLTDARVG